MWETLSGSLFLRFSHPGYYPSLVKESEGRTSTSTEDIEKDLHRSLPEYAGYQSEEGIGALRRVLRAYSWRNQEVGYCQAMNILAAAILMWVFVSSCRPMYSDPPSCASDICRRSKRSGSSKSSVTGFSRATTRQYSYSSYSDD